MSDNDYEGRVSSIAARDEVLNIDRQNLAEDLGAEISVRLLELFAKQSTEDRQKRPTFESWLGSCFNYDMFSAYDIFREDDRLKTLLQYVATASVSRHTVSQATNTALKKLEYTLGLNARLNDVQSI